MLYLIFAKAACYPTKSLIAEFVQFSRTDLFYFVIRVSLVKFRNECYLRIVSDMGQSDSESTSSSMRGNPGSPRDISVIFDEPVPDIQSRHNICPISPAISTSSSEASELDNSVILINQTPKQSEIPVIDLTSTDDSSNSVIAGSPGAPTSGPICDDFAQFASNFRLRQALEERLAGRDLRNSRSRLFENRLRGRRFRSRPSPYTALHGDASYGGRHGNLPQSARVPGAVPASAPDNDDHLAPIIIDDELSPYVNHQAQYGNATNRMSSDPDEPVSLSNDAERIRHRIHLENSQQFREARAVFDRIQPIHPRCFLQSDEALAQRMQQDEYNREIEEQHRLRESLIHQSTPNVGAGSLPTPLPVRRRRPLNAPYGTQGLQELLLPFVSVVSLPPPLHHYGDSGPGHSTEGEDYEALWNLSERIGLAKARGLSKEVIDCIPSFRYSASSKDSSNGSCVVCMSDYIKPEKLRRLPCHHDFHAKCIDRWLKNNRTCPVCREQVSDP